ncbi:MAG: hypothetical protein R3E83_10095 [Burkholderiaceae bacterium]
MRSTKKLTALGLSLAASLLLAGCGDSDSAADPAPGTGSGGPGTPPVSQQGAVPDTATASSGALVQYLQGLSASDERSEPSDVISPAALNDEVSEPIDI